MMELERELGWDGFGKRKESCSCMLVNHWCPMVELFFLLLLWGQVKINFAVASSFPTNVFLFRHARYDVLVEFVNLSKYCLFLVFVV